MSHGNAATPAGNIKDIENVMTTDEEMDELSNKPAKASRQKENCTDNAQFVIVFCAQALPRRRTKIRKTVRRPAHVQITYIFARNFAYLLCGPDAARRHSEAHSTRKVRFLMNTMKHRFARTCFLLERGILFHKYAILMHIRTKRGRKMKMLKNDGFYHYFLKLFRGSRGEPRFWFPSGKEE